MVGLLNFAAVCVLAVAADRTPPREVVDLDLPPEKRWLHITTQHNCAVMRNSIAAMAAVSTKYKEVLKLATIAFSNKRPTKGWLPDDQWLELKSIADACQMPVGEAVALAGLYDFTAAEGFDSRDCTSIVAQGTATASRPVHGRNLDYPLASAMTNITAIFDWHRGGKLVFSSVSYFGMVNFNTVVKPGAFSLSHDQRDDGPLVANFFDLFIRRRLNTFSAIRKLAETATSYRDALDALVAAKLDAASYMVIAGTQPGEGALITRDRDRPADILTLSDDDQEEEDDDDDEEEEERHSTRWFLLETK